MSNKPETKPTAYAAETIGFGTPVGAYIHHYILSIGQDSVTLIENLGMKEENTQDIVRAVISRQQWDVIGETVERVFNRRLKEHNLAPCSWEHEETKMDRLLGRELCVLLWAIQDTSDAKEIHKALLYWFNKMTPEELWWLFSVAVRDAEDTGWRKALRYAFAN
jgi:hypothetical protein